MRPASFHGVVNFAEVEGLRTDSVDVMICSFWNDNKESDLYGKPILYNYRHSYTLPEDLLYYIFAWKKTQAKVISFHIPYFSCKRIKLSQCIVKCTIRHLLARLSPCSVVHA